MNFRILFILILLSSCHSMKTESIEASPQVSTQDLTRLIGEWNGTLTYLNYSNNEPYTMPANLKVTQGTSDQKLMLDNIYPNETQANYSDVLTLSDNGTQINKIKIISRTELPSGGLQIITEYSGQDDNKSALIRNIYLITNDTFINKKEVQFDPTQKWIKRNEYSYQKK